MRRANGGRRDERETDGTSMRDGRRNQLVHCTRECQEQLALKHSGMERVVSMAHLGVAVQEFGKASFQRDIKELKLAANYNSRSEDWQGRHPCCV